MIHLSYITETTGSRVSFLLYPSGTLECHKPFRQIVVTHSDLFAKYTFFCTKTLQYFAEKLCTAKFFYKKKPATTASLPINGNIQIWYKLAAKPKKKPIILFYFIYI